MPDAARRQLPFRPDQLEFNFAACRAALPTPNEMWKHAAGLLRPLGASELATRLRIQWNNRMRTAVGRADYAHDLIWLNPLLQNFGAEEIDRTLRHELAHLLAQFRARRRRISPHGTEWRAACRDLGLVNEAACHQLPMPARRIERRYLYRCQSCAAEFPRVRRLRRRSACVSCCRKFADGKYDPRFTLRLVKTRQTRRFAGLLDSSRR